MIFQRFELVVLLLVTLVPVAFFTTYAIAVINKHIEPFFPFISDTGTFPPESCIFGEALTIGAFLNFLIAYVRYLHTKQVIESKEEFWRYRKLNIASFILGSLASFSLTLVGNFQETNVSKVHVIGAGFSFIGLLFYTTTLTVISYKLKSILYFNKPIFVFRILTLTFCAICVVLFYVFDAIAKSKFNGQIRIKWQPTDGGFAEHIISTSSEWAMTTFLMLNMTSFIPDFRKLQLQHLVVYDPNVSKSMPGNSNSKATLSLEM